MIEKPISGDEEQRRAQTRAARFQSGLPPEEETPEVKREPQRTTPEPSRTEDDDVA